MSSSANFDSSFEAFREQTRSRQGLRLMERFCDISQFLLRFRVQLRYGRLSRAPLNLLRLEILPDRIEFDCLARAGDPWDVHLADRIARKHITLQVLHDAIDLRAILYRSVPEVESARIRIYRNPDRRDRELIIVGHTHRNDQSARGVHSLIMRAKVLGFQFQLDNELLRPIPENMYASIS